MERGAGEHEQQTGRTATRNIPAFAPRPTRAERYATGESLRKKCPRSSHGDWKPSKDRPDPVQLIEESDKGRIPQLVPLRHGRMLESPFTFYRGAALNMAADLATTPTTGVRVQACGDAHLVNFRGFATPERQINFDIHDLDETLPAPWEWDLKRLAASFVLAGRENGLDKSAADDAALACARSYREHMAAYSEMGELDVWYARLDPETFFSNIDDPKLRKRIQKRVEKRIAKEQARTALEYDFPKLAKATGEQMSLQDNPPTIYHVREDGQSEFDTAVREGFARYRDTLADDRRTLLDRFELKDIAMKVVGRRQCRHHLRGNPADGGGKRSTFSPTQGSPCLSAGSLCREECLFQPWPTGGDGSSAHAIGQRHFPWLDRRQRRPSILHPATQGRQNQADGRNLQC